ASGRHSSRGEAAQLSWSAWSDERQTGEVASEFRTVPPDEHVRTRFGRPTAIPNPSAFLRQSVTRGAGREVALCLGPGPPPAIGLSRPRPPVTVVRASRNGT